MLKKYSSVETDLYIEHDAEMLYFQRIFGFDIDLDENFKRKIKRFFWVYR